MTFIVIVIENFLSMITRLIPRISGAILFLFTAFLIGSGDAVTNPDYALYMNSYEYKWSNFESGYTLLSNVGRLLGLDYAGFRMIIAFLSVIILMVGILRITNNLSFVAFFYAISLFTIDAIQVRNSLMLSIVVLAFSFLIVRDWKHYLTAGVLLFLASTIHSLALAFFVPYLLSFFKLRIQRIMGSAMVILSLIMLIVGEIFQEQLISVLQFVLNIFGSRSDAGSNVASVYTNSSGSIAIFAAFMVAIVSMLIVLYLSLEVEDNTKVGNLTQVVIPMVMLGLVAVMMMETSSDYVRLLRNTSLFVFIYFATFLGQRQQLPLWLNKRGTFFTVCLLLVASVTFYLQNYAVYPAATGALPYTVQIRTNNE
ncbi:EpsG family protein [Lactiplantibacillus pentosus]|uniref:EpsG family protein n=1 Tax=Lactiplantibacillus pentosus TaxID=1589 RepID=UPI0031EE895B